VAKHKSLLRGVAAGFLTVGQTEQIIGVKASTLRFWEEAGLIRPSRSAGRYRLFTPALLDVLKCVKYLRDEEKLRVSGIKQLLGNHEPQPNSTADHKREIGERLKQMRQSLNLDIEEAGSGRAGLQQGLNSSRGQQASSPDS
jgi:MerR family transcriptional regulator/heat shock protein HspR